MILKVLLKTVQCYNKIKDPRVYQIKIQCKDSLQCLKELRKNILK